jgi:hypothetical protein
MSGCPVGLRVGRLLVDWVGALPMCVHQRRRRWWVKWGDLWWIPVWLASGSATGGNL